MRSAPLPLYRACQGARCSTVSSACLLSRWSGRVLRVGDVLAPRRVGALAVDVEHREVRHETRRSCPVPMVLARLEEHTVAGADHLDRTTATLREPKALGDE